MSALQHLLIRLADASGSDRELDREIGLMVGDLHIVTDERLGDFGRLYRINPDGGRSFGGTSDDVLIPHYTGSTDVALSLAERALPGIWWMLGKGKTRPDEPIYGAQLLFGSGQALGEGEHECSLALAICIAVLRAREWA